jgi:lipoate-protein ligase A
VAPRWLLVDDLDHPPDAAGQMAADVALLDAVAAGGTPALRLYRWAPPALSLGRFQTDADVDVEACSRHGVEVVRRPTGGRALLHGGDVTYAVAFPRPPGAAGGVDALYEWVATGLIAGLACLGVAAAVARHEGPAGPVCFAGQQGADLRVGDRKLCGSAQVRRGGGVLQHGSVLTHRLPFDELDLVRPRPGDPPAATARARLRAVTVTLEELGVTTEKRTVADALVEGLASALDLRFTVGVTPPVAEVAGPG